MNLRAWTLPSHAGNIYEALAVKIHSLPERNGIPHDRTKVVSIHTSLERPL
jgi:hypothetical protein